MKSRRGKQTKSDSRSPSLLPKKVIQLVLALIVSVLFPAAATAAGAPPAMVVPGKFNVTPGGAATYTIPIAIPPGTAGMVPALSLGYSSQSGDGIAGLGWNLGGLSSISRCPRTLAQDGIHGGVNYNSSDRFCLDGERLILISGTYGADGSEYRTEIESFSRIIAHGSAGSGPAWFEVHTKAGQIMQFGNTTDSQVLVVDAVSGVTSTARAWAINRISDTVGNYLTVTYNCSAVSGACTDTSRTTYGEEYPLEIDYTGNASAGVSPYNSVRFSYSGRADSSPIYQAGGVTQTTVLLTNVKTYQASNLVSDYQLAYRAGTATQHSRVTSVTLCGGSSPQICLKPTTFGWQGGENYLTMTQSAAPINGAQGNQILPGDFNGDGLTDVITVNSSQCSPYNVYIGTPSLGLAPAVWGSLHTPADGAPSCSVGAYAQALTGPNSIPYVLLPIIAHQTGGDENDSILVSSYAGNFEVQALPFPGSIATSLPGDYNGDGLIDFLQQQSPTSYAYLGNGSGSFTADGGHSGLDPSNTEIAAADFDGDGCTDILGLQTGVGGSNTVIYLCNPAVSSVTPPNTIGYNITLGDFNGDGKTDMLLTSATGAGKLYFSTGTGFVLSSCSVPSGWGNYQITSSNWDGDGKADLLLIQRASGGSPGTSQIWLSTGDCFAQATDANGSPVTISTSTTTPNAVLADWNNDGVTDIWMQEPYNSGSASPAADRLYTFAYTPELMVSASNGIGAFTNVTYDRLNQNGAFYTVGTSAIFPTVDVDAAFYAVREVDDSDGHGACIPYTSFAHCYVSTYAYAGGQTDLHGRGFLGFAKVTITDPQTHTVQTTDYSTAFPYIGSILAQTKTFIGNTHALSTAANVLANNSGCGVTPSAGVYFSCVTETVTTGYDLNDSASFPTSTTDFTYDSYGNTLTVAVALSDGSSKTTTNTYSNDTTNWFLGRLLTSTVNSIVGSSNLTRHSAFTYDSATGLLTQQTLESGVSTCNGGSDSCAISTAYIYDPFGHQVTASVFGTGITTRVSYAGYDSLGQFQTSATNALGQAEQWAFDPRFGLPTAHIGPNGLPTNWAYDGLGRVTVEARADGTSTESDYFYCSDACPTYGAFFTRARSFGFDGRTQIGPDTAAYFDALSRGIAADTQGYDGSTIRVATIYDSYGRVSQTSRPYFLSGGTPQYTTNSYDALGRVIQILAPNATVTAQTFNGLVTATTNALGQTTTTTKNAEGLTASVEDAASRTTSFAYDAFGNVLTATDPAGNVVSNSYDIRGNKYQSVDPDMGTWTYVHDVAGELTSQTDAKSQVTSLTYDLLGRALTRAEPGLFSSWTFGAVAANDNIGQLIEAKACTNSSCSTVISDRSFTFDSLGRPATSVELTGGNAFEYQNGYNSINGKIATITYPSGLVLGHSYNSYGYLCALAEKVANLGCTTSGSHVIQIVNARDAEGHLTQSTAGNGVVTNQSFDPATGLPTGLRAGTSGAVASFDYAYDGIGNLTSRTDHDENYTEGFCYDTLNRLSNYATGPAGTSAWGVSNWGALNWGAPCGKVSTSNWGSVNWNGFLWGQTCGVPNCKTVFYDGAGLGNITAKSDVGAYNYPTAGSARPHAISSITGTVDGLTNPIYTYDANGNMTCESIGAGCTGTVGRQVSFTSFNMADTITQGAASIAFIYDDQHQRIRQTSTVSGVATVTTYLNDLASGAMSQVVVAGGGTPTWTDYIKLDGQIIAQRSSTFSTPTWGNGNWGGFVWGASISASNWGAHNWGSFNWNSAPSSSWEYFTLDHLGSVAVVTDQSGAVVQRLSYDAWGRQRNPDGSDAICGSITSPTTRGFTNQEQIPAGCLVNLNARIYDPTLGKFMAADPVIGDPLTPNVFNRYAYVLNNPLSFTDPTGLCFLGCFWNSSIFKAVAAVVVVAVAWEFLPGLISGLGTTELTVAAASVGDAGSVGALVATGAVAGAASGAIQTGTLEGTLMGGLLGAASAGVGAAVSGEAGSILGSVTADSAVAQGLVGGIGSVAEGGDFGSGFLSAGLSTLGGAAVPAQQFNTGALVERAAVGGVASILGGGKFANGAVSGAFSYAAGASDASNNHAPLDQFAGPGASASPQPGLLTKLYNDLLAQPVNDIGYLLSHPGQIPGAIADTLPGVAPVAGEFSALGAAANEGAEGSYTFTKTVEGNAATRPYINSPLTIQQIESTGQGVPDPGGLPGALRYDVPGSYNGSRGTYQLVIDPKTNTVYHFLFTGK